jgi:hypothetical protein
VGEVNGVNIPFTIGIQTPMQLQFMILCCHNGCHIWHQWCEISFVHINGFLCTLHQSVGGLDYHKLRKNWKFGGMVIPQAKLLSHMLN